VIVSSRRKQASSIAMSATLACRALDGMDQTDLGIDADVHLHAEVPLVALLRLDHLGVAISVASTTVPRFMAKPLS